MNAELSELEHQVKIFREQVAADEDTWQKLQLETDKTAELLEEARAELRGDNLDGRGKLLNRLKDEIENKKNEIQLLHEVMLHIQVITFCSLKKHPIFINF